MNNNKNFSFPMIGIVLLLFVQGPAYTATIKGTLKQTIDTSVFNSPSPDPSGLAFFDSTILDCDGEVNETPLFMDANLFEITLTGDLLRIGDSTVFSHETGDTPGFSQEPVGCALNTDNGNLFVSDDNQKKINEIHPGEDGLLLTDDDIVVNIIDTRNFGNEDPEGVAYGNGALFSVDGLNSEVFKLLPGPDKRFGTPDDVATHFDTLSLGIQDPEGIAYDPDHPGHLYITGSKKRTTLLGHVTTDGELVRMIDYGPADTLFPAGVAAVSQAITGDNTTHVYISDRGVDNNDDPNENDGKIFVVSVPLFNGNQAPSVVAGLGQVIDISLNSVLDGTVMDDGRPNPPGELSTTWTQISGPGTANFTDASLIDTMVSFSAIGDYRLRLTADDSELSGSNDVQISVTPNPLPFTYTYLSTLSSGIAGGLAFADEDIIVYNDTIGTWSMYFDGSDVSLDTTGVDAFHLMPDGSILLSFSTDDVLITDAFGNTLTIDNADIVRFIPTVLGGNTAGTFEWYFDGSDVGFDRSADNVDAIGFTSDGNLVVSSSASFIVPGVSGNAEDLIAFTADSLSQTTSGTWQMHFDGSDVELGDIVSDEVNGVWINDVNGDIHLSTLGAFAVMGASGGGGDIFKCIPGSTGNVTVCNSYDLTWNGIVNGLPPGTVVDAIGLNNRSANTSPTVTINVPHDKSAFDKGESVTFKGSTIDTEDDDAVLTAKLTWNSSLDGYINSGVSINTSMLSVGTHTITASVRDNGGLSGSDSISITINSTYGGTVIEIPVNHSKDDAEEIISTGLMNNLKRNFLSITGTGDDKQTVGMRFTQVHIPQGATILDAYIQFTAAKTGSANTTFNIWGQDAYNPPAFTSLAGNISSRKKTRTSVLWTPVPWLVTGAANSDQRTPNIAAVIQEITNRPNWINGSSLVVMITGDGNGSRIADAHTNSNPSVAPLLHIEYDQSENTVPNVTITTPAGGTTFTTGDLVTFTGSATDAEDGATLTEELTWVSSIDGNIYSGASFNTSVLSVGTHTITASVSDSEGLSGTDSISITINPTDGRTVIEIPIKNSKDDAEEKISTGLMNNLKRNVLTITGFRDDNQVVGMRFTQVNIPQGATILNAYVQFTAAKTGSANTTFLIWGQDDDNPLTFTSSAGNISSRQKTRASIIWTPIPWLVADAATSDQRTPNLAAVIEEITNRANWINGSSLVVMITGDGNGSRIARAHTDGNPSVAPLLHIEYDQSGNTVPNVTITTPSDGTIFTIGDPITFTGSANDADDDNATLTSALSWDSSLDGNIGSGAGFDTSALTLGTHTVTASVRDSGGLAGTASITFTVDPVGRVNTEPSVTISAPRDSSAFDEGEVVIFTGSTTDVEDDNTTLTSALSWVSSLDGVIDNGGSFDTSALSVGTHTITASVSDSEGLSGTDSISITINPTDGGTVIEIPINNSKDDAEEKISTGLMNNLKRNVLAITGFRDDNQIVGMRFTQVNIPQGATILDAYIQFTAVKTGSANTTFQIWGQDDDNPLTFTSSAGNISSRQKTSASVLWTPVPWLVTDAATSDQRTPNIAAVIEEITNRANWVNGNSLVVMITGDGNGSRIAGAHTNGNPSVAPLLYIEHN